jgi:excisionase family DNA binding protein
MKKEGRGDMDDAQGLGGTIEIRVPVDVIDAIAERVADRLAETRPEGAEGWIGVEEAAAHLACPKSRIYDLVSARRIPHERDASRLLFRRSEIDAWVRGGGGIRR